MTATAANIGFNSKYALGNGAVPEVFTQIAEVTKISPPKPTLGTVDATHMQSANATKEFIAGLIDPGSASVDFNLVPGGSADLAFQTALTGRAKSNHQITFPNGVTWTFAAIVTDYSPGDLVIDGKMSATANFKISGSTLTGVGG